MKTICLPVFAVVAFACCPVLGEPVNWIGGSGWSVPGCWDLERLPAFGDAVTIDNSSAGGEDSGVIAVSGEAKAESVKLVSGRLVAENCRMEVSGQDGFAVGSKREGGAVAEFGDGAEYKSEGQHNLWSTGSFMVAPGVGEWGKLVFGGGSRTEISNSLYVACQKSGATGIVEVCGSARVNYNGKNVMLGRYAGSYARMELKDNAVFSNDVCAAVLNVGRSLAKGELKIMDDSKLYIHTKLIVGMENGGYGTLEVRDNGYLYSRGANATGMLVGYNDTGAGCATGLATVVSGGVMANGGNAPDYGNTRPGISVGRTTPSAREKEGVTGGAAYGRLEIQGGFVTNHCHLAVGWGMNATGVVEQTGGQFVQGTSGTFFEKIILGFGGGDGTYLLNGGELRLGTGGSRADIYVGGFPDGDGPGLDGGNFNAENRQKAIGYWNDTVNKYYNKLFMEGKESRGLLRVDGGELKAAGRNMFLGAQGTGELEIGTAGGMEVENLTLCGGEKRDSVVRFEPGENGELAGVKVNGKLTIEPGARIELHCGRLNRRTGRFLLIDSGEIEGVFNPGNVKILRAYGDVFAEDGKLYAKLKRGFVVVVR